MRPPFAEAQACLEFVRGSRGKAGAAYWIKQEKGSADRITNRIFTQALGRSPNPAEAKAAKNVLGSPVTKEGIADLLWIVTMLPDFQLIR